jgi:hypothetical protein
MQMLSVNFRSSVPDRESPAIALRKRSTLYHGIPTDHTDLHDKNYLKPPKVASDELEFWSFSIWIFGNFGISGNTLISVHQLARFFIR